MAVTILEALENAEINLGNVPLLGTGILPLVFSQLHIARVLLEKGYSIYEEVEPILDEYGDVENAPNIVP